MPPIPDAHAEKLEENRASGENLERRGALPAADADANVDDPIAEGYMTLQAEGMEYTLATSSESDWTDSDEEGGEPRSSTQQMTRIEMTFNYAEGDEEPTSDGQAKDQPISDGQAKDQPISDEQLKDQPISDEQVKDQPISDDLPESVDQSASSAPQSTSALATSAARHLDDGDFRVGESTENEDRRTVGMQLDEAKISTIKQCMANIQLSPPAWASNVDDAKLRQRVMQKLRKGGKGK